MDPPRAQMMFGLGGGLIAALNLRSRLYGGTEARPARLRNLPGRIAMSGDSTWPI